MVAFTYKLIDAIARHHANPETFNIPSPSKIAALKIGDFAKIGVEFPTDEQIDGERFWVQVNEITDGYVGVVDNSLVYTAEHGIDRGEIMRFERRHILDVLPRAR